MCISGILFKFQSQFHTDGDLKAALLIKLFFDLPGNPLKITGLCCPEPFKYVSSLKTCDVFLFDLFNKLFGFLILKLSVPMPKPNKFKND